MLISSNKSQENGAFSLSTALEVLTKNSVFYIFTFRMSKVINILLVVIFLSRFAKAQFFNARCTKNEECNSNQLLQCFNGYCQCDSRSQVFDHGLQKCVIRPGSKCYFGGSTSISNRFLKCSRNSVCVSSICECQPGYSVTTSGTLCKPNFENGCKTSADCDKGKGLDCIKGVCQCRNASLSYQGMFGCVDGANPEYIKMMSTLKQTESLLKENHINMDKMIEELDNDSSNQVEKKIHPRQLFTNANPFGIIDSSVDLATASQNQYGQTQQAGGLGGLGGLFNAFNSLGSILNPLQQIGNSLGQAYGPPSSSQPNNNNQRDAGLGGYSSPGGTGTGVTGGYSSGPAVGGGQNTGGIGGGRQNNFPLITNFLNLFNRLIPFLRRLSMLLNPFRIIQRLLTNFRTLFPANSAGTNLRAPGLLGLGLGQGQGQGGYSSGPSSSPGGGSNAYGPPQIGNSQYGVPLGQSSSDNTFNQAASNQQDQAQAQQSSYSSPSFQKASSSQSPVGGSGTNSFESPSQFQSSSLFSSHSSQQNKREAGGQNFQSSQNQYSSQQPKSRFPYSSPNEHSPFLPEHL